MIKIILIIILSASAFAADDWHAQETKLNALTAKVKAKQEELDKMIDEKKEAADKESAHDMMDKLSKTHRALLEKDGELRELRNYIRFNYPSHGVEIEKKYTPLRRADMEKYEAELGIDGKLNRVKQRVHEVYGKDVPKTVEQNQEVPGGSGDAASETSADRKAEPSKVNRKLFPAEPVPDRIKISH